MICIKTHVLIAANLLLLTALIFTGCKENPTYPLRNMPESLQSDSEQVKAGHDLFMSKCAACHGKSSEGRSDRSIFFNPPAPDFTEPHYQKIDPAYLYWRIEVGKTVEPFLSQGSVMPAWGVHFSKEQIWQIVAYLQARAH